MANQTQTAQAVQPSAWFMSNPFVHNLVYEQLVKSGYERVVGLDIGHGDLVACEFYFEPRIGADGQVEKDPKGNVILVPVVKRLDLNSAGNLKLPAMIRFTDKSVIIGADAADQPGFVQHFKVEPAMWNELVVGDKTYGDLMEILIRTLLKQIKEARPELESLMEQDKLLLAVGCPASEAWTNTEAIDQYRDLLKRATNCQHVTVMPESNAAIMAAIHDPKLKAALTGQTKPGIAVLDAGSSTLDYTCVYMGKHLVVKSLKLGGHDLDNVMLEVALEKSGLTREQISSEQIPALMVKMRALKEKYYPNKAEQGHILEPIWGRDAQGKGNPGIRSDRMLDFDMDQAFMWEVLNRKSIRTRGVLGTAQSWLELCEQFINYVSSIQLPGVPPVERIILTGGTCNVKELEDAVREIYGDKLILSQNPSVSVAAGLCFAKGLEIKGSKEVDSYREDVKELANQQYRTFVDEIAVYIAEAVCEDMKCSADDLLKKNARITISDFFDDVKLRAAKNPKLVGLAGEKQVQAAFTENIGKVQTPLLKKVNEVSEKIYGSNETAAPKFDPLDQKQINQILGQLNISGTIKQAWVTTIVPGALFSVLAAILFLIGLEVLIPLPPVGFACFGAAAAMTNQNVQQTLTGLFADINARMPRAMLRKVFKKMSEPGKLKKNVKSAAKKTAKTMIKNKVFREEFEGLIQEQGEILLGKVLFLVYDHRPDC